MKKNKLIVLSLLFGTWGFAQVTEYNLEYNNINAQINNGGVFFNDPSLGLPGYEVPKLSGSSTIYSSALWFGGVDINGQLKLAATQYTEEGDFFPGALTTSGDATCPPGEMATKSVYYMSTDLISNHMAHFEDVGYVVPTEIAIWPAHGDVGLGLDNYLAPFQDVDGNGVYEPALGDYPVIKGDAAVYLIMNDKAGIHETGSDPIGLEIHMLFYQFVVDFGTDEYLNNTTFVNVRVINRGTQTLNDFKAGYFLDADLGDHSDDYVGFDSLRNVMYGYNGWNTDFEYGDNPPAMGVVLLNKDVAKFAPIGNDGGPTGSPSNALEYYHYMNGKWRDGASFTEGGTGYGGITPTNFVYHGNPNYPVQWSEIANGNISGNRAMMMSVDCGTLHPFDEICFDYAVIYNRDGNYLENVNGIIGLAENVKSFYDSFEETYCEASVLSIDEQAEIRLIDVYPNPSNGTFTVDLVGSFDLEIFGLDGRAVYAEQNVQGSAPITTNLANGTYLITMTQDNKIYQSKIVIRN